jgi:Na+/melibiose symporter-like transporter
MYASITLGNATLTGAMSGWLLYFYLPPGAPALVPAGLFGLVILASRLIHWPLSAWMEGVMRGRRSVQLRWLVAGAVCMPVLFGLLWSPPQAGESLTNLLYAGLLLVGFNLAAGIQQSAYGALAAGLGETERGMIGNWRMGFLLAGSLLAGLAGPLIQGLGYTRSMWIFAGLSAVFLIVPGLFLRRGAGVIEGQARSNPLAESIEAAWSKPAFRAFALSWGFMWLATTFTFETLPYIVTEICGGSKADSLYLYFAAMLVPLIAYPAVERLAARFGAAAVFRASLLAGAVVAPGLLWVGGSLPLPALAQGVAWIGLEMGCLAGAQSLPGAITAVIGAGDQSAFGDLIDQTASGLALAIIPFFLMLGRSQLDAQGPLGVKLLGPASGLALLAALVVFGWFKSGDTTT